VVDQEVGLKWSSLSAMNALRGVGCSGVSAILRAPARCRACLTGSPVREESSQNAALPTKSQSMSHLRHRRIVLLSILSISLVPAFADEPKGTFGFTATVDTDGVFNPTLKSVLIGSVQPGLPAARAGIVVGDSVIEVEGVKVAGANAMALANRMKKKPGETVVLKLQRAGGDTYVVTLTAAAPAAKS
jgi:hypothetical protein